MVLIKETFLTVNDIAKMMDLSCVRTNSCEKDIIELTKAAEIYKIGQVSVMHCFIPLVKQLLRNNPEVNIVGNVSFPSGSDSTTLKVLQAREMVESGCNEIDMVMNIGKLKSENYNEVEEDVKAVVKAAEGLTVKVIIEMSYLNTDEAKKACEICISSGATFVKTGTGWVRNGTTVEDIKFIKSTVGDKIKIKASGGIRDLDTLIEMYKHGATRFGVNSKSGKKILDECINMGGKILLV